MAAITMATLTALDWLAWSDGLHPSPFKPSQSLLPPSAPPFQIEKTRVKSRIRINKRVPISKLSTFIPYNTL
jgi:hypothetical protein